MRFPSRRGITGTRLALYLALFFVAIIAAEYVVVPIIYPPAPPLALSPSTNIPGSPILFVGRTLPANTSISALLNGQSLKLTGTCVTSTAGTLAGCQFIIPQLNSGSYNVTVTGGSKSLHATLTVPRIEPPESTFIVSMTSIALAVVTQLVTKRMVDLNAERKMRTEFAQYQADLRDAVRTKDKAKEERLKKKQAAMTQMNTKVSFARLKVTAITFIPFIALYYIMAGFLGGFSVTVSFSPLPIPFLVTAQGTLPLFWWYSISSVTFSPMLTKLFGTST